MPDRSQPTTLGFILLAPKKKAIEHPGNRKRRGNETMMWKFPKELTIGKLGGEPRKYRGD
jgi:hypothetical protein